MRKLHSSPFFSAVLLKKFLCLAALVLSLLSRGQDKKDNREEPGFVRENFVKKEVYIAMRDGKRLFTVIYTPKEDGQSYPVLLLRTPYSAGPYGDSEWRTSLGPNDSLMKDKYIFVYQDVRGRYLSEGNFEEMTPYKENKTSEQDTDESSDTWDTVDWLLKNIRNNNGRVGLWGISYPGFYASASLPDAHPAIKAVSPQAPVTDEFIGDDVNHNGAFFLLDNFDFDNFFDIKRNGPIKQYGHKIFNPEIKDAYQFFLDLGPLKNSNSGRYFNGQSKIWNEYLEHSTYDAYWKARNIRTHLKNIRPAVLVVGGWFDAEDMFGALRTYEAIEQQSLHSNNNYLVMGPWTHGAWAATAWNKFGVLDFDQNVNEYYHAIETKFFNFYLKDKGRLDPMDKGRPDLAEATVFETGVNQWKQYPAWPPANALPVKFYLREKGGLSNEGPASQSSFDEYLSDPARPVPYADGIHSGRDDEYPVADQRFAAQRPDVLVYQTDTLAQAITVTGRLRAELFIAATGTDADLVVKLIDVLPGTDTGTAGRQPAGYQRLVRADVFRCKFRNSFEIPSPMKPGQPTKIYFELNEIAHCFKKGHRVMVQVQSSWFPLVDRNPQQFINIPTCREEDFQKASIRVYHDREHPSGLVLPVMEQLKLKK